MIAFAHQQKPEHERTWQPGFLDMLPGILSQLRFAFRALPAEEREEAIAAATASAAIAYARLHQQGKADVAYPVPLARFAAAQYRVGRRAGNRCNSNDVMSPLAFRRHGLRLQRLDHVGPHDGWKEVLVEDGRCTPAELAASRIDFAAWLRRLPRQKRRIAKTLATGEATTAAARKHRLTPGRISQIRRELAEDWDRFHNERCNSV